MDKINDRLFPQNSVNQKAIAHIVFSIKKFAILEIVMASFFIAICAQIGIPLYFSPIPVTAQTFAVMLMGSLLGPRKGALAVLVYLLEGLMGLPVFSLGGSGLVRLCGPNGGYLWAFVAQAYIAGHAAEKRKRGQGIACVALLLFGSALQLGLGYLWLSQFFGIQAGLSMGLYPFVPGECIKIVAMLIVMKIM